MKRVIAALLAVAVTAGTAVAHSWYPSACCGGDDCFPVACDQLVEDRTGWVYLPTGNHFETTQVQPSQDRSCHVCLGLADKRSLCAFVLQGA